MTSLQDGILSAFIDQKKGELNDSQVTAALAKQGITCTSEDVRRHLQSLSPALFQLLFNTDKTLTIRVEPTIEICEPFLKTRCPAPAKTCPKLHICRYFGHCNKEKCGYPHDLTRGINRQIIVKHHCQHISPPLLIKLLRLQKSPIQATRKGPFRPRRRGPRVQPPKLNHASSLPVFPRSFSDQKEEFDRQVDVSFPSSRINHRITLTDIESCLNDRDIKVKNISEESDSDFCRRATILLERMNDVEKLLRTPVLDHQGTIIKFKRTQQFVDKTSFILKTAINNKQDKIESFRLQSYIETLVNKGLIEKTTDISTDSEQIIQVQCLEDLDFERIRQKNLSKSQFAGKDLFVTQIYQCDALAIHSNDDKSLTEDDLKRIFQSIWMDIFVYDISSPDRAEVEFIDANAFKRWISMVDLVEKKFRVTINRLIDSVEENSIDTRSTLSNDQDVRASQTTIKFRPDWALIVTNRSFKAEYQEFIRKAFGGDVEVNDNEAIYTGNFPKHLQDSRNEVIFRNKTNDFMRKFQCEKFEDLAENQIQILRASSDTIAFSRLNEKEYMVATKSSNMPELKRQILDRTSSSRQSPPKRNPSQNEKSARLSPPPPPPPTTSTFSSTYPITTSDRISIFSIERFVERLQRYLQETFQVNLIDDRSTNEKTKGMTNSILLRIHGRMNDVENAIQDLDHLFSSLCTKKFDEKTDGHWTKMQDAIQMINHHFQLSDMICIGEQVPPANVHVYYFDITNPQFGTDEERIEDIIKDRFRSVIIPFNQQSISSKLMKEWTDFEETIRQQDNYQKNICFSKESDAIYLFGLPELVKDLRLKFEQIKHKYNSQPCKITLKEEQINYLTHVAKADINKLANEYKSHGCDISITRLRRDCEFLAPATMHAEINDKIQALAQIRHTSFNISEPGFDVLISKEPERLLSLVKSKCYLEKSIETHREQIPIPKARVADPSDGITQPTGANARPIEVTTVNIGHSTVTILIGDLSTQAVDAIVLCSSSDVLCQKIIRPAGPEVKKEYDALKKSEDGFPNTTSGGTLPCKKIIFIPWSPPSRDPGDVQTSLNVFIDFAFMFAISEKCTSIAFPAIGCGQLNLDASLIARSFLLETRKQLKAQKTKMNISFVLLAEQKNVYDAFVQCLNDIEKIDLTVSSKLPSTKKDHQSSISFDRKTVKITLISSNDNHLIKSKDDILQLVRSCSITSRIRKQEILDWPQDAIYKYYDYCLKQRVIPKIDLDETEVELVGSKDAVHEAEKYLYELTSQILNDQRIRAVSRGVIWSVESTLNSDKWEQYSYKLNGIIEDAHLKGHSHVDIVNENNEKCRIIFAKMEEKSALTTRRIRRVLEDSTLPKTWQTSTQNCIRVPLSTSSPEYQQVLTRFHDTMLGKYSQMIKIERIQNERWYKQYAAHREEFRKRYSNDTERSLFHGCLSTAADQIIDTCFNRAFAGANGILYGYGVYFHVQARYSHQYAAANAAGERTMFLASVLIGKTCKGNDKMKVVPHGFDTTTDGEYIYVVYHDAGAYAEYLITYK